MKMDNKTCLIAVFVEACTAHRIIVDSLSSLLDAAPASLKTKAEAALARYCEALRAQIEIEEISLAPGVADIIKMMDKPSAVTAIVRNADGTEPDEAMVHCSCNPLPKLPFTSGFTEDPNCPVGVRVGNHQLGSACPEAYKIGGG